MIILASRSPRRIDLLTRAGVEFEIIPSDADETPIEGESPEEQALRLAKAKALDIAAKVGTDNIILGADTIVVIDGLTLGKPRNREEGRAMLETLSGRPHVVITGVCIIGKNGRQLTKAVHSDVSFRKLGSGEIEKYLDTGEPFDRAGSYAIQGIGAFLIDRVDGSYTNVVGLPLKETLEMLAEISA